MTGRCSVCTYRIRLRKDGTVGAHRMYEGTRLEGYCKGQGKPPRGVRA